MALFYNDKTSVSHTNYRRLIMEIKSSFLGTQSVDADTIITFPNGIPGFEEDTRFKLFHQEGSEVVYWMQSLDTDELLFSVAQPSHFKINYSFILTDEEEALLKLENNEDILILIILQKTDASAEKPIIKGSITSPLIINEKTLLGLQKHLPRVDQSITLTDTSHEVNVFDA